MTVVAAGGAAARAAATAVAATAHIPAPVPCPIIQAENVVANRGGKVPKVAIFHNFDVACGIVCGLQGALEGTRARGPLVVLLLLPAPAP
jgi:hypothetical protein